MTNDRVKIVESELHVTLPDDYRDFLTDYGFYDKDGLEIYGYTERFSDIDKIPCVIGATKLYREGHNLSEDHIVIGHTGFENYIITLNTKTNRVYETDGSNSKYLGEFKSWFEAVAG